MASRSILVRLRAEVGQYKRDMESAAKATEQVGTASEQTSKRGTSSLGRLADSAVRNKEQWTQVGGTLAAVGTGMTLLTGKVGATGVAYNQLQQTTRAALTTLLGGAKEANAQMDKLDEFARNSPFAKQVFIEAQQQMIGFGIETQKVIPYLDSIQDAVAAAGGSNQDISELSRIFSQISASAKITATDLREFGNRGIDAATIIGESMGKTGAEIRESITAGTLDADEALDALASGMEDRFGGAAENVKNTFAGATDRVRAAIRDLSADLTSGLVDPSGGGMLVDAANSLADFLRLLESLPGPVKATASGMFAITGAAAAAGGGFMLLLPRIRETQIAMRDLGFTSDNVKAKLAGVATSRTAWAKGIAGIAGMTLAMSDFDDKMEGSNAATGALMGTIAGPWGAAIGGAIGLVKDLTDANKGLEEATEAVNEAHREGDLSRMREEAGKLRDEIKQLEQDIQPDPGQVDFLNFRKTFQQSRALLAHFTGQADEAAEALRKVDAGTVDALPELMRDTATATEQAEEELSDFATQFKKLQGLLSASDTLIAYEKSLMALTESIKENGDAWDYGTEAGQANLEARNELVEAAITRSETLKEAGKDLAAQRVLDRAIKDLQEFARTSPEARKALRPLIQQLRDVDAMEASPEVDVDTAKGDAELAAIKAELDEYGLTRKNAVAAINDLATGKINTIQGLMDEYGITKKEAVAMLSDLASGKLQNLRDRLEEYDRQRPNPKVDANNKPALKAIGNAQGVLDFFGASRPEAVLNSNPNPAITNAERGRRLVQESINRITGKNIDINIGAAISGSVGKVLSFFKGGGGSGGSGGGTGAPGHPTVAMGGQTKVGDLGGIQSQIDETATELGEAAKKAVTSAIGTVGKAGRVLPRGRYSIGMPYMGYPGHYGADYPASTGTPVYAPQAGVVTRAMTMSGSYGRHVYLGHPGGVQTRYAHLSGYNVSPGQFVRAGQNIGWVGSTGNSTGPHLHFEYRRGGSPLNPAGLGWFARGGYTGDGGKYDPAGVVHKGEFVHDKETTARYRPVFEALHRGEDLPGFVEGGEGGVSRRVARRRYRAGFVQTMDGDWFAPTRRGVRLLNKELKQSEKALQNERDERKAVVDQIKESRQQTRSSLTSSLFDQPDDVWLSQGLDVNAKLKADIANAKQWRGAVTELRGKGVRDEALSLLVEEGNLGLLQEYAGQSRAELQTYQSLVNQRTQAVNSAARQTSSMLYGAELQKQTYELRAQREETRGLRQDVKQLEKRFDKAVATAQRNRRK